MSDILVNITNPEYVSVTQNKGIRGIGTPYAVQINNEILVNLSDVQTKITKLAELRIGYSNATISTLRSSYGGGDGDGAEDRLIDGFKKRLRDILFPEEQPSVVVGDSVLSYFNGYRRNFSRIDDSRDYIVEQLTGWINLLTKIKNYTLNLSRRVLPPPTPTPSLPPAPTPAVTWRNCVTGMIMSTPIPSDWIQTRYTGTEGGFCREPVFISIVSSSAAFSYSTFTPQNPIPVTYTLTNTSVASGRAATYLLNFETDSVFTVNPTSLRLSVDESKTVTITIPSQNINTFLAGTTNFRLQMDIVKL